MYLDLTLFTTKTRVICGLFRPADRSPSATNYVLLVLLLLVVVIIYLVIYLVRPYQEKTPDPA